jgi:hypothetical protein
MRCESEVPASALPDRRFIQRSAAAISEMPADLLAKQARVFVHSWQCWREVIEEFERARTKEERQRR